LAQRLKAAGIPTQIYYPRPLHHQPAYRAYPVAAGGVPVAERLPSEVLSLPMHPYLSAANQERIASAVRDALADNVTE
jgi:dTDP-4-amino-4,6-dideoxygalactose transaminase